MPVRVTRKSILSLILNMVFYIASGDEEYEFWEASKLGDVKAMKEILDSLQDRVGRIRPRLPLRPSLVNVPIAK